MTADDPGDTNIRDRSSRKKDLMMKRGLCAPVTFKMKNKDAVTVGPCSICLCVSLRGQMASKVMCWGLAEVYKPSQPFKKLTVTHPHQPHQWLQNSTEVIFRWHDPCFYFRNLKCKKKLIRNDEDYFKVKYSKAHQDQGSHLQHPVISVYSPTPFHHPFCDSKATILNSSFHSISIVHHVDDRALHSRKYTCWRRAGYIVHCDLWVQCSMIHLAPPKPQIICPPVNLLR